MGVPIFLKNLGGAISKNSPAILTGLAVGGMVTTVIFAVRATPKASEAIKTDSGKAHDGDPYGYTKVEALKSSWKFYIPAACMGAATIACIIGANSINQKRNAALATIYGITDAAFKEYKEKVVETIGKNKELKIQDDIVGDRIVMSPPTDDGIIYTGHGEVLCCDDMSGRYFKSDIEFLRQTVNTLNYNLRSEQFITLNDLYYAIGLSSIAIGELLGWDIEHGEIEVKYVSKLTEKGVPCLVLKYNTIPRYYNNK